MDNATYYFTKTTNRELYHYVNILEYHDGTYVLTNPISDKNIREMRINMDDNDVGAFDEFLERVWGIDTDKFKEKVEDEKTQDEKTKRRGRKPKTVEK